MRHHLLVSYPTRWSLLFVFGFLWWSSSWQWQPHIVRGKMLMSLLRARLAVFGHFFAKCIFYGYDEATEKIWQTFLSFFPKNWMINSTHGAFRGVFEICGLIRKFWKTPVLACNQLSNRSGTQAGGKVFQKMRINPQILKTLVLLCKGSAH